VIVKASLGGPINGALNVLAFTSDQGLPEFGPSVRSDSWVVAYPKPSCQSAHCLLQEHGRADLHGHANDEPTVGSKKAAKFAQQSIGVCNVLQDLCAEET